MEVMGIFVIVKAMGLEKAVMKRILLYMRRCTGREPRSIASVGDQERKECAKRENNSGYC